MKLHRLLVEHVVQVLEDVFEGGYQADKVLERLFKKNSKLGARDRKFIAEASYELIRHWRKLIYLAGLEEEESLTRGDAVRIMGVWILLKGEDLPPWPEFKGLDKERILAKERGIKSLAVLESIPDWLNKLGEAELGKDWPKALYELNRIASDYKSDSPTMMSKLGSRPRLKMAWYSLAVRTSSHSAPSKKDSSKFKTAQANKSHRSSSRNPAKESSTHAQAQAAKLSILRQ